MHDETDDQVYDFFEVRVSGITRATLQTREDADGERERILDASPSFPENFVKVYGVREL